MEDSRALFISWTVGFSQSLNLECLLFSPGSSLQAISFAPDNSVPHGGLTSARCPLYPETLSELLPTCTMAGLIHASSFMSDEWMNKWTDGLHVSESHLGGKQEKQQTILSTFHGLQTFGPSSPSIWMHAVLFLFLDCDSHRFKNVWPQCWVWPFTVCMYEIGLSI